MLEIHTLLRTALRANAAFSMASGFTLLFFADFFQKLLGLDYVALAVLQLIGASLIGFSIALALLSLRRRVRAAWIHGIIALDGLWVIGSIALILAQVFSEAGGMVVGLVAFVVLTFALLQYAGLRPPGEQERA